MCCFSASFASSVSVTSSAQVPDIAAVQWLGGGDERRAFGRPPASSVAPAPLAGLVGLGHQRAGATVEDELAGDGVLHRDGLDRRQPCLVRPESAPRPEPARRGEAGRPSTPPGREAGGRPPSLGRSGCSPRPRQRARRPAVDRDRAASPPCLEGAGLAGFEQGAQPPAMVGIGRHQRASITAWGSAPTRVSSTPSTPAASALPSPPQASLGAAVLHGQHGWGVEGLGRGLGRIRQAFEPRQPV